MKKFFDLGINFRFDSFQRKGDENIKPSSFENAVRLQFDWLIHKVMNKTVKNYNKELARRVKHEVALCEIPLSLEQVISLNKYVCDFTAFYVYETEATYTMNSVSCRGGSTVDIFLTINVDAFAYVVIGSEVG